MTKSRSQTSEFRSQNSSRLLTLDAWLLTTPLQVVKRFGLCF